MNSTDPPTPPNAIHPNRNKRTPAQKEEDLQLIASLRLRRYEFAAITRELNSRGRDYTLSLAQVYQDYKKAERRWQSEAVDAITTIKSEMLAELQEIRKEAWRMYERSKTVKTTKRADKMQGGNGRGESATRSSVTQEDQIGDPATLRLVVEVQERISKLMGLDAPAKQDIAVSATPVGIGTPSITFVVSEASRQTTWAEQVKMVTGREIPTGPAEMSN